MHGRFSQLVYPTEEYSMSPKTATKPLTHADFPAYVTKEKAMGDLNAKRVDCVTAIGAAREALARAEAEQGPLRVRASSLETEAAALLGEEAPDRSSVSTKEKELRTREHDLAVIDTAIARLSREMERLRQSQASAIVASHAAELRTEQLDVVNTGLAYARAVAKARAHLAELENSGVRIGGSWEPPVTFDPGSFGDPSSPVAQMLQLARNSGVTVPEVPEIAAARRRDEERARQLAERDQQHRSRVRAGEQMNQKTWKDQAFPIGEQVG